MENRLLLFVNQSKMSFFGQKWLLNGIQWAKLKALYLLGFFVIFATLPLKNKYKVINKYIYI